MKYLMESKYEGKRIKDKTDINKTREQLIKAGLKKGMSVLDVGCATAVTTLEMAKIVYPGYVIGIDSSEERIQEGREYIDKSNYKNNIKLKVGDIYDLPFQNNSFDFVWSRFLFEYLKKTEEALNEMYRVCKKGGYVINGDLDGNGLFNYPMKKNLESKLNEIMSILEKEGFDPFIGRKLYHLYTKKPFTEIMVWGEVYHLICGKPNHKDKKNWDKKIDILIDNLKYIYNDKKDLEDIRTKFKEYINDPNTFTYSTLIFVKGIK